MHFDADLGRYSLVAGLERFASMFLYLSDVEEGGETIFPEADDSTYRRGVSCGLVDQGTRTVACPSELVVAPNPLRRNYQLAWGMGRYGYCTSY